MAGDAHNRLPVLLLDNIDPQWPEADIEYARAQAQGAAKALRSVGHPVTSATLQHPDLSRLLRPYSPHDFVLLNWCEELPGIPHSEALVVKELEGMGFTVTGASSRILELTRDKGHTRRQLWRRGLPIPAGRVFERLDGADWDRFPAIVKAAREHCSCGLTRDSVVTDRVQLRTQIERVLSRFGPALVEEFIDGREFRVAVWGRWKPLALPAGELDFSYFPDLRDRVCTYDAKFTLGSEHYEHIVFRLPPPLTPRERSLLERVAMAAHRAVGAPDYTRIDLRLRDGVPYVLDVNPNADIASDTSMALCAQAGGYSYGAMLSQLVRLAAARHPRFCWNDAQGGQG